MLQGFAVLTACLLVVTPALGADDVRTLTFRYETRLDRLEAGAGPLHIWIPLARHDEHQRVVREQIDASIPGEVSTEAVYGNRFWHGSLERTTGQPVSVVVETTVVRRLQQRKAPSHSRRLSSQERDAYRRFLEPNQRVAVKHPILEPMLEEIRTRASSGDSASVARAIYDWVVDNIEYKKVGTGWGNGDTFWACSERFGNCTDFHSLFISFARSEDIPARFEIGFPIPEDRRAGEIAGYHCWVEFYLPGTGWFPIDASEAFKHPEKREFFYGSQPADRIHFSTGRDLRLGIDQRSGPLNYFIYPHVELEGRVWRGELRNEFSYREE